jgi:hypothetical protein
MNILLLYGGKTLVYTDYDRAFLPDIKIKYWTSAPDRSENSAVNDGGLRDDDAAK